MQRSSVTGQGLVLPCGRKGVAWSRFVIEQKGRFRRPRNNVAGGGDDAAARAQQHILHVELHANGQRAWRQDEPSPLSPQLRPVPTLRCASVANLL